MYTKNPNRARGLSHLAMLASVCLGWMGMVSGQDLQILYRGRVQDPAGQAVGGAAVSLLESALSTVSDAQGNFELKGTVTGVGDWSSPSRRFRVEGTNGNLVITNPERRPFALYLFSLNGSRLREWTNPGEASVRVDFSEVARPSRGMVILRVAGPGIRLTAKIPDLGKARFSVRAEAEASAGALAKPAVQAGRWILQVAAPGFLSKRFAQSRAEADDILLGILPVAASWRDRIKDFLGADNTFRLAYLTLAPEDNTYSLNYADFAEMGSDSLPVQAFPDSKGAVLPSWSPDGRFLAYETGREGTTVATSRIYIQPLQGARKPGPAYPATNPRWWSSPADTFLVWCTSGKPGAYSDLTSATLRQKFAGADLAGSPQEITKGSFNGGLSADGRYLASAQPWGVMKDVQTQELRLFHIYPGHPKDNQGNNTDSLQTCNPSISPDPENPARMMFVDFGVRSAPAYDNGVIPALYDQHQVIFIGDFNSPRPGRLFDSFDSPKEVLDLGRTWDDPEWSNHPDFAVATTRDGNVFPVSQQDVYLLKLSTRESLKIHSRAGVYQPVLWVGPQGKFKNP